MSLSEDPSGKDVSISVEQALSSVLGGFRVELSPELESSLTDLLLHQMGIHPPDASDSDSPNHNIVRSTRFIAVRFANRCLPYKSATARWIDILAINGGNNERSEVLEEGRKGLDPYWFRLLNPINNDDSPSEKSLQAQKYDFPSFPELIEKIFGTASAWDVTNDSSNLDLAYAYIPALAFCRCILLHQALTATKRSPIIDADWERNIDAVIANDEDARYSLKGYFHNYSISSNENQAAARALQTYLQASFTGMISSRGEYASRGAEFLLELCPLLPNAVYIGLSANISSLQGPIFSTKKVVRETASHLFGILARYVISGSVSPFLVFGLNLIHVLAAGKVCSLKFSCRRLILRYPRSSNRGENIGFLLLFSIPNLSNSSIFSCVMGGFFFCCAAKSS